MSSPRPAALLLPLLALLCACPGREDDSPSAEGPHLPELALPEARVGSAFGASVAASGGSAPLRYTLEGLAPGLTYEISSGEVRGSPTQGGTYEVRARVVDARGLQDLRTYSLEVRPAETDATVDIALRMANWNLEWFGADKDEYGRELGPSNELLQLSNVRDVMLSVGADVWAVQEVVSDGEFAGHFDALKAQLPGYDGFMSSDARVSNGPQEYAPYEQKLALLYRSDRVKVLGTPVLLPRGAQFETPDPYAGRPPMRVDLRVSSGARSVDVTVVVVHLKAHTGTTEEKQESYQRRARAAELIKAYLDQYLPTQRVLVLGDWNDDLDTSIASGNPTPFQNFLTDAADYTFLSRSFTDTNQGTTVGFSNAIDHQLATNELKAAFVTGSETIVRPGITGYDDNTSDHYPVSTRFVFPAP